jgi:nitroreductase
MNVIDAIHGRRSIRAYRPEPVDRTLTGDLLWAAVQAPTPPHSGDEPWDFVVVEGVEPIDALGQRALQYARDHQPPGRPWTWADRPGFRVFWGAPAVVLISAKHDNPDSRFDCCRAAQNLMLAAHVNGLGTCWVGAPMPWLESPGVAQELRLREGFDPAVAMVVGYAVESPYGNPRPRPRIRWHRFAADRGHVAC